MNFRAFIPGGCFLLFLAVAPILPADSLTPRAEQVLTRVLESGPSTEQIHAAEVLIQFGRAPQVFSFLNREPQRHDATPIYRVIYWRALAGASASATERQAWVEKIWAVIAAPGLPDRLHAVESAAKLGESVPASLVPALDAWSCVAVERDAVFLSWLLLPAHRPDNFPQILVSWLDSPDEITRLRAAYILRWLKPRDGLMLGALTRAANATSDLRLSSAIILGSACILRASPSNTAMWRRRLEAIVTGGEPPAIYHALQGLMTLYTLEDLPRVAALLDHPDADVRVAAAWTVLTVESRCR